jgi:ABC-2 type transport system permease protein
MTPDRRAPSLAVTTLRLARLEMTAYWRSAAAFAYGLLTPTMLLVLFVELWFPPDRLDQVVPEVATMSIIAAGVFSIGVAITEQRKDGTLKTYLASPLPAGSYLAAQVLDRTAVLLAGNGLMVAVAWVVYDIRGANLVAVLAAMALVTAVMLALGFLVAARARNAESAGIVGSVLFLAALLLSGVTVDVSGLGDGVRTVLEVLPFHPAAELLRSTWNDRLTGATATDALVLVAWLAVFATAAARWFRWTPEGR